MVSVDGSPSGRTRWRTRGAAVLAALAVILAVVGVARPATASTGGEGSPYSPGKVAPAVRFNMGMAHPNSYDHATGVQKDGWGNPSKTMGSQWDWVDYHCGDIVPFLVQATNLASPTPGIAPLTFTLHLAFDAATDDADAPGAGFTEITGVKLVSLEDPSVAAGASVDGAAVGAELVGYDLVGAKYTPGAKLTSVLRVSNLPAGATALVQIDVRLTCKLSHPRGGSVSAEATGATALPGGEDLKVGPMRQSIVHIDNNHGGGYFSVIKTPSVETVTAPGAPVDFTVEIVNHDEDPLPIDSIHDDVFGDVTAVSDAVTATTCGLPMIVPAHSTKSCVFTGYVAGETGDVHHDRVCVIGLADEHSGEATVGVIAADEAPAEPAPSGDNPPPSGENPPPADIAPIANNTQQAPVPGVLDLTNTPDRQSAVLGDVVTFTLVVTNTGTTPLTNVRVIDELLRIDNPVGNLAVGESRTLSGTHTVTPAEVTALEVVNPALATAAEAPTVERTARVPVTAVAGVRVGGITATLALPTTGAGSSTRLFLWLAAALTAMGSAYLAAGRKPQRIKW